MIQKTETPGRGVDRGATEDWALPADTEQSPRAHMAFVLARRLRLSGPT
jgi:hypothetical protein